MNRISNIYYHKQNPAIYLFFVLLFIASPGFQSCSKSKEKTSPVVENITASVYAAGVIKTKNQYSVYSTVSGILSEILVKENDSVKAGSPLFRIADKISSLSSDNAALAANYATLSNNREKLTEIENNIELARSKYRNDSLLLSRQQNLWNQGIGTKAELEQRELSLKNSRTSLESSKLKYNDLLKQLSLNAAQSRNNLAISKNRESDLIIRSEIDGKVYSINKEKGEMVNQQTSLATIGQTDNFQLELQVDEYDIVKIKEGQKVLVSMDSYKGEVFEAIVTKLNPLMNERTKSFLVEAIFTRQPPVLYPNLTVEANIITAVKEKALTIPRNYLVDDSLVYISNSEKKSVKTGLKDFQKVEILSGLQSTDVIYKP